MHSDKYPERHWTYESREEQTQMPAFMNDGYAPPDWELIQTLEKEEDAPRQDVRS